MKTKGFEIVIYLIGVFLILILFGFGSFSQSLYVDVTGDGYHYDSPKIVDIDESVTMLAFGDVMLGRYVRTLMDRNGMDYPFEKIGSLEGPDFVVANLEGPIKEVYVPTGKSIEFRFKPDVIWVLKNAGFTTLTIANNHALDQGWQGREDTKKFLTEAGIDYFGHPKNEKEDNVLVKEMKGKKFAFIGYDDTIFKINEQSARELISQYDAIVDYVVVFVHWGAEYRHNPTQRKVNLGHLFVDSGADLVIGHHPHVVQTFEVYNGAPIFYSLGNFVFDQYWSGDTQEGMGVKIVFEDEGMILFLHPYALPKSQPQFMEGEARAAFLEKFIGWGDYSDELSSQIRAGEVDILR